MQSVNPSRGFVVLALLAGLSACSDVHLNYGLAGSRLSLIGTATPAAAELADLQILAQVQAEGLNPDSLQLRIRLRRPGAEQAAEQILQLSLRDFLSQPALLFDQLPPGPARLDVALLDETQQSLAAFDTLLDLQPGSRLDLRFALGTDAAGRPEISLQGITPRQPEPGAQPPAPAQSSSPSAAVPGPALPGTADPEPGSSGSSAPAGPRYELRPRLLEQGITSLVMIWEAPLASTGIRGYQITVNGRVVAENHPVANYRLEGLSSGNSYAIEIAPVLADGSVLPASPLNASTSSAGGGGGGGGSTAPVPAVPPAIERIEASRTLVTGLGYPVQLTGVLVNNQTLPAAAYRWQCNDCGDASFSSATGAQVTWQAPSTPGTYEITLTLNDGTHPPVSENLSITVQHGQVNVNVIGDYR